MGGGGEIPSEDSVIIHVIRSAGHMLSSSMELLMDYKNKKINWKQYIIRFKKEIDNEACREMMKKIKKRASEIDGYLVCVYWNKDKKCHRFY